MSGNLGLRAGTRIRSLATGVVAVLALFATIVAFFNRLALGDFILARGDTYLYFYPYWQAAASALADGRVPLWNPSLFMGAPFLANSQIGFFYPLNWPFWILLSTPYAMSASIITHLLIAGVGVYLVGRRCLSFLRPTAILAALLFCLGGYLTAQVEHINQIQGVAWLPWYFVVLCTWRPGVSAGKERIRLSLSFGAILNLQILSGHTQTVFISMFAVGVWLAMTYIDFRRADVRATRRPGNLVKGVKHAWRFLAGPVLGGLLGLSVAAIQLVPTLQLSRHSIRQGGLPPNEVLSFSLQPLVLAQSLLPAYDELIFSEYVAILPITALLLAVIGGRRLWNRREARPWLLMVVLGLLLALGRFNPLYHLLAHLPGFNLFRAPARWSVLYALGVALLAAAGWQALLRQAKGRETPDEKKRTAATLVAGAILILSLIGLGTASVPLATVFPLAPETNVNGPSAFALVAWITELVLAVALISLIVWRRSTTPAPWAIFVGVVAVLFLSTRVMPYNHPTTARAYFEQRAPVSRLVEASNCQSSAEPCEPDVGRLLSLSDIFFDLGDQAELNTIYSGALGENELFDYVVASKQKEILGPNLPLAYGLRSVDGFDGGLLPLQSYAAVMSLIMPEGGQPFDGRLREQLDSIPDDRWLDHFSAKYIITDKVGDQWRQGIFFDMKHPTFIAPASEAVEVGYLPGFEATDLYVIGDGTPGTVMVGLTDGSVWSLDPEAVESDFWRYRFPHPAVPEDIALEPCQEFDESKNCDAGWHVNSLALADVRDGSFMPLLAGDYRLMYSGDVKIYENLDVMATASLIYDWDYVQTMQDGLAKMGQEDFEPGSTAVVIGEGPTPPGIGEGQVVLQGHYPERSVMTVESDVSALLLIREAYYPGWRASIDGKTVEIWQTDSHFQSILVPPGEHMVELEFNPASYRIGRVITLFGLALWFLLAGWVVLAPTNRFRKESDS